MRYLKGFLICIFMSLACGVSFVSAETSPPQTEVSTGQVAGVNINTAGVEELAASLNGVGQKRAQAIVDYRNIHGPFTHISQLTEIKGIGDAVIEKNRDRIKF